MDTMTSTASANPMKLSFDAQKGVAYSNGSGSSSGTGDKVTIKQDFHIYSPTSADPLESTKEAASLARTGLNLAGVNL
jgi:hypothetical protein